METIQFYLTQATICFIKWLAVPTGGSYLLVHMYIYVMCVRAHMHAQARKIKTQKNRYPLSLSQLSPHVREN